MTARGWQVSDYSTLTIAATAVNVLNDGTAGGTKPALAKSFIGTLESGQVRARGDGTAPTSTEGVLIEIGDTVILSESELGTMRFIRTGSVSGVLKGHYTSAEASLLV